MRSMQSYAGSIIESDLPDGCVPCLVGKVVLDQALGSSGFQIGDLQVLDHDCDGPDLTVIVVVSC